MPLLVAVSIATSIAASGCRFAGLITFMIRYRLLQRIGEVDWLWCLVSQFLTEENEALKKPNGMLFADEEKYLSVKSVVSSIWKQSPKSFHIFPWRFQGVSICFHAENVCYVQLQSFKFPAWPLGGLSIAHFEAQPDYDGSKPKIPMMFPGCIHGKEKD
ncbi:MAG: hypothetical protein WAN11_05305 [Syntrophobacteraceae bacterium]